MTRDQSACGQWVPFLGKIALLLALILATEGSVAERNFGCESRLVNSSESLDVKSFEKRYQKRAYDELLGTDKIFFKNVSRRVGTESELVPYENLAQVRYDAELTDKQKKVSEAILRALTDKDGIKLFVINVANEVARRKVENAGFFERLKLNVFGAIDEVDAKAYLTELAQNHGWPSEIIASGKDIPFTQYVSGEEFRRDFVGSGKLWIDLAVDFKHGMYSHLFQILYCADVIDRQFGAGTMKSYFDFMGTEAGYFMWAYLFDLGPTWIYDFRSPMFFNMTGIGSLLGLK